MKYPKLYTLFLLISLFTIQSCGDDEMKGGDPCHSDFDQEAMFVNFADNLIIPTFELLKIKVDTLSEHTSAFINAPSSITLEQLKASYVEAYTFWQNAAHFNFGPAEEVFLRSSVNNFPLNVMETEDNISSGSYDFDQPDNFDKGFPAIDYLLYGLEDEPQAVIDFYSSTNAAKHKDYLLDVVADIQQRVDHTLDGWKDSYRESFITNTGTAAGTSLSLLINHFNENYELIKREKLGIPSGVLTLGFTNPENVEAFYSGISIDLAKEALEATRLVYLGANGLGLDDYLIEVDAQKDDTTLHELIKDRLDEAIDKLNNLDGRLSDLVENDTDSVINIYNDLSILLVNLKTDMPSVLCVSITYIDNPSDSD